MGMEVEEKCSLTTSRKKPKITAMQRIIITGVKANVLQDNGRLPKNLAWNGEIPPSYSISIIPKENGETVVALVDSFAGGVAYAVTQEKIHATGKEVDIDSQELNWVRNKYPMLYEKLIA